MSDSSQPNVDQLLAALADKDGLERQKARNSLVEIGTAAVPGLITALNDNQQQVRWEAAKTLTEIADPTAADAPSKRLATRIWTCAGSPARQ